MILPEMQYSVNKTGTEIVALRGINFSDQFQDGDLADSKNISARRFPYLTTRKARVKQQHGTPLADYNATAMTSWKQLVAVEGTNLIYNGTVVGQVTTGAKQFAVVNTKMVIWPDKVYLDLSTLTIKPLGRSLTTPGATFTTTTMTLTNTSETLTTKFNVGDCVTISGCINTGNNKDVVIKGLTDTVITVAADTFVATTGDQGTNITIERKVPDMDYICESENRLWGCSSESQTIYASALGDPTNFYVYEGLTTDSYALAVGTEGDFTGCCKLSSSVLFWKETKLHKLLGSYPAEYSLYTYDIEGLQAGCNKSLQVINEVLFYKGLHGVYAYSGGSPTLISERFGNRQFTDAVAGNDGDTYYLSLKEGNTWYLFLYEITNGIWILEDNVHCVDFTRIGRNVYFLDSTGKIYLANSETEDSSIEWKTQLVPFYDSISGKKRYHRLLIRFELPLGSYVAISVRQDGGVWKQITKVKGKKVNVVRVALPITRCDKYEIKLEGKGPCTILDLARMYVVGSEV